MSSHVMSGKSEGGERKGGEYNGLRSSQQRVGLVLDGGVGLLGRGGGTLGLGLGDELFGFQRGDAAGSYCWLVFIVYITRRRKGENVPALVMAWR